MGLFSSLFGGNNESTAVTHPCTNCASDCSICPAACDECREYKEKLTDLLYNVEHIDAFRAKYEVVSTATESLGSCTCEACGAPNPSSAYVCEYCGTALRESTGKILVTTANDIPNPILEAQDLIFERFELQKRYLSEATESSGGLFSALSSLFGNGSSTLGDKMTEDEITKAAELYEVSVSSYLQGLDNGKYLTYARKKQKDLAAQQQAQLQAQQQAQNNAYGMGAAGVGAAGMMGGPRPPMGGQPGFHGQQPPHPQGQGFGGPNSRPGQQQPQRPAQQSAQRPAQQPAQRPVQQQTQRPAQQQPTQRPAQQQTQRPAQQAARPAQPTKPANNMPTRPSVSSPLQKNNPVSRPAQNSRPAQPSGARPTRPGMSGGINKGPGKK